MYIWVPSCPEYNILLQNLDDHLHVNVYGEIQHGLKRKYYFRMLRQEKSTNHNKQTKIKQKTQTPKRLRNGK